MALDYPWPIVPSFVSFWGDLVASWFRHPTRILTTGAAASAATYLIGKLLGVTLA